MKRIGCDTRRYDASGKLIGGHHNGGRWAYLSMEKRAEWRKIKTYYKKMTKLDPDALLSVKRIRRGWWD